jgi:hypothetical protein
MGIKLDLSLLMQEQRQWRIKLGGKYVALTDEVMELLRVEHLSLYSSLNIKEIKSRSMRRNEHLVSMKEQNSGWKGSDHLGDPCRDGRIILKCILMM